MAELRAASSADFPAILDLNNAAVPSVNELDHATLEALASNGPRTVR